MNKKHHTINTYMNGKISVLVLIGSKVECFRFCFCFCFRFRFCFCLFRGKMIHKGLEDFRPSLKASCVEDIVSVLFGSQKIGTKVQEGLNRNQLAVEDGMNQRGLSPRANGFQRSGILLYPGSDSFPIVIPDGIKDLVKDRLVLCFRREECE